MNTDWISSSNNNIYGDLNKKLQEDNNITCIFQEIITTNGRNNNNSNKRELNDLIQPLKRVSEILNSQKHENDLYSLYLSHVCLKVSGTHGIKHNEILAPTPLLSPNDNTYAYRNKILDYQGLLRLGFVIKRGDRNC